MSKSEKSPQAPSIRKNPSSLRATQIIFGVITLALAGMVMAFPTFGVYLLAAWLSVSLLFGGIDGVVIGIGVPFLSKSARAISIGAGIVAIVLSISVLAFPAAAVLTTSLLLAIALVILGAGDVARGIFEKRIPGWTRAMMIAVGAITVALSVPVTVFPIFGVPLVLVLLATALLINGASSIATGITGAIVKPIYGDLGRGSKRTSQSEAA